MRTLVIIAGGLALWGACLAVARFCAPASASALSTATGVFVALWLLAAAANLWLGVTRAGYSVREELPIFLLIFLLPAALAVFVQWKFF
jgi:hypothetical protein